jgi:capsular exopolysaccharide synthesis family protein
MFPVARKQGSQRGTGMGWFFRGRKFTGDEDSELIIIVDRSIDPHLVVYHDPKSFLAEQYRHFRTNLMALNKDGSPRSLVFTSSTKGDGKSISVANIALSLVECDNNPVCLIDCDFRAPALGRMFGFEEGPGLSDLLQKGLALDRALRPTKVENLHLIQAGKEPRNPTELLGSDRFINLVNALKQDFKYILLDTPPVFPYTDACILGARCNGIVFVVKMDVTSKSRVEKAIKALESAGGQVVGTFLTAVRPSEKEESRDYYYYSDEYSYGEDNDEIEL